jgi:hypothetical protein
MPTYKNLGFVKVSAKTPYIDAVEREAQREIFKSFLAACALAVIGWIFVILAFSFGAKP